MPTTLVLSALLAQTPAAPATGSQPAIGAAPTGGSSPAPAPASPRTEVIGAPTGAATTTTTVQQPSGAQPAQQPQPGMSGALGGMLIPVLLIGMMIFMFWTSSRTQKKERQRREEMINAISTNDTVQTVGGIIGRVAEIRDDEVILRVDESTNTKMRFAKSAVQQVMHKAGGSSASSQSETKPAKQTAKV